MLNDAPVMVIGGSGFLGSHTSYLLAEKGFKVVCYDLEAPPAFSLSDKIGRNIEYIKGDILDKDALADSVGQFHVGGIIDTLSGGGNEAKARQDPRPTVKINVKGTLNALEAARKHDIKRFVYIGTGGVYGSRKDHSPIKEDEPITWRGTVYHPSHYMGEILVEMYRHVYGMDTIILRPLSMYGVVLSKSAGAGWPKFAKFYDQWIRQIFAGKEAEVRGADTLTDLTYVKDVASAISSAYSTETLVHSLFNASSGTLVSHKQIAEAIGKYLPSARFNFIPGVEGNPLRPNRGPLDTSRARQELNFVPQYSLDRGMKEYIEWLKEGRERLT